MSLRRPWLHSRREVGESVKEFMQNIADAFIELAEGAPALLLVWLFSSWFALVCFGALVGSVLSRAL